MTVPIGMREAYDRVLELQTDVKVSAAEQVKAITDAEAALRKIAVRVEASVQVSADYHEGYKYHHELLRWARHKGTWSLMFVDVGPDGEEENEIPLASASLRQIGFAVRHLQELFVEMARSQELLVGRLHQGTKLADDFTAAVLDLAEENAVKKAAARSALEEARKQHSGGTDPVLAANAARAVLRRRKKLRSGPGGDK